MPYTSSCGHRLVEVMTPDHTLAVDCNVRDSAITHSQYAARRVKDAICDQFRDKIGRRPSVDTERPMIGLNLHVYRNHAVRRSLNPAGFTSQARLSTHPDPCPAE